MMENMVLGGIFRHGREKMSRKLRKLHNEKLLNFLLCTECYLGEQIKGESMGGAVSHLGTLKNIYKVSLVEINERGFLNHLVLGGR